MKENHIFRHLFQEKINKIDKVDRKNRLETHKVIVIVIIFQTVVKDFIQILQLLSRILKPLLQQITIHLYIHLKRLYHILILKIIFIPQTQ
jgi:hypothetical protein